MYLRYQWWSGKDDLYVQRQTDWLLFLCCWGWGSTSPKFVRTVDTANVKIERTILDEFNDLFEQLESYKKGEHYIEINAEAIQPTIHHPSTQTKARAWEDGIVRFNRGSWSANRMGKLYYEFYSGETRWKSENMSWPKRFEPSSKERTFPTPNIHWDNKQVTCNWC